MEQAEGYKVNVVVDITIITICQRKYFDRITLYEFVLKIPQLSVFIPFREYSQQIHDQYENISSPTNLILTYRKRQPLRANLIRNFKQMALKRIYLIQVPKTDAATLQFREEIASPLRNLCHSKSILILLAQS